MDDRRREQHASALTPAWLVRFPPSGRGRRGQQLAHQIRRAVAAGVLRPGDRLPATRPLAKHLGLARGTVVGALEQLVAEGLLEAERGSGTFVAAAAAALRRPADAVREWQAPRHEPAVPAVDQALHGSIDFRPCRPAVDDFPVPIWRRSLDQAARSRPRSDYSDPLGEPLLREAIAHHLRTARGLEVEAGALMICNGALQAMHLLAQVYLSPQSKRRARVIMEDPGYPLARQVFESAGAEIIDVPVDQEGLDSRRLPPPEQGAELLYLTPANQFPTGARLTLPRRQTLLAWAQRAGALIVEDDYDGEFCYDVEPLPTLAAIGGGQVAYCGSFSKTLFPDMRIGFLFAHPAQVELLARVRTRNDYTGNQTVQRALARFISDGHYERYLLRMRRRYGAKRQLMRDCLERLQEPPQLLGGDSGLNLTLRFEGGWHDRQTNALTERAAASGVLAPSLERYQFSRRDQSGLVLGYAALSEADIERGVKRLFRR